MGVALLIVLAVFAGVIVVFMASARELEMRHERWEEFRHPPDSVLEDDDDE